MSTTSGRPPSPADRLTAVAAELNRLAGQVDALGRTVYALVGELPREAPQPFPQAAEPAAPWAVAPPADHGAPPVPPRVSGPYSTDPVAPLWTAPTGDPRLDYPFPAGPRPPRPAERLRARLSGAALLAATGGAVTLLGLVLLLVLAASRGWFAPPARVLAGAALGVVLVALGGWLHRSREARTGALALVGTGVAALYLDVAAATSLYSLLPVWAGLALALVVAGGGLLLADRWRSSGLALGAVAGAAVLAPAVTASAGPLLVGLALALQVAAAPVVVRRGWEVLAVVTALFAAVYGLAAVGGSARSGALVGVAVGVLLVGLGVAVAGRVAGLPVWTRCLLVAAAGLPLIALGLRIGGSTGAGLALLAALGLLGVAAWERAEVRVTGVAAGSVAVLLATLTALDGSTLDAVLLAEAVVVLAAAAALRSRLGLVVGAVFGVCGLGAALGGGLPVAALVGIEGFPPGRSPLLTGLLLGVLTLAAALLGLVAGHRAGWVRADASTAALWAPLALVALYGELAVTVTSALLVAPDRAGFVAGHAIGTVSWTIAALVLFARGLTRPVLRVAGAVLVAAALGKLVLFDLVALDGLARVGAFLGAGLVLLAAGSRYARLVARARGVG